jgi:pilus assembly protein CpaC
MDKVPGLGDLPILGKIFRSRSTQKSADELLVVVTPHFVKALTAEEKAALPAMPEAFLPAVVDQKKGKAAKTTKPEFVGPRGQQIPKP